MAAYYLAWRDNWELLQAWRMGVSQEREGAQAKYVHIWVKEIMGLG